MKQVVMAYLGVQSQGEDVRPFLEWVDSRLRDEDGPAHVERARYVDHAGYETTLAIAYWSEPERFARWHASPAFTAFWQADARLDEGLGYFLEVVRPEAAHFETILSAPDKRSGAANLASGVGEPIQEHGYWGAMRDRLPLAAVDPLEGDGRSMPVTTEGAGDGRGRRIRVTAPDNLCVIRSGQDWSGCEGSERQEYLQEIHPTLVDGMQFLIEHGQEVGCFSCRMMTELDEDWAPKEKTFGLAYFRSLGELERWAESHPTHLRIFGTFIKMATRLGPAMKLRLWHEVSVLPVEEQFFEYINCHPGTGLLPFQSASLEAPSHSAA